jgi:signal transduction histidine kinase
MVSTGTHGIFSASPRREKSAGAFGGPPADPLEATAQLAAQVAELAAANNALQAVTLALARELRAPLRNIESGGALIGQSTPGLDPQASRALGRILDARQRIDSTVTHLLAFSHASCRDLAPEPLDLTAMAFEVAAQLSARAPGRQVEWRIEPGLKVHADAALLRLALANLLGNAFKFSRDAAGAVIEVGHASRAPGHPAIYVRDNGIGFDSRAAAHLFQAFHRLPGADKFEGSGIGLAIARRVIERHGGSIRAEAYPGRGATFTFSLPEQPATRAIAPRPLRVPAGEDWDWLARFRHPAAPVAEGVTTPRATRRRVAAAIAESSQPAGSPRSRRLAREARDVAPAALMLFGAGLILVVISAALT